MSPVGKDPNVVDDLAMARTCIRTARAELVRGIEKVQRAKLHTQQRNASGEFDKAVKAMSAAVNAIVATDDLSDASLDAIGLAEVWL